MACSRVTCLLLSVVLFPPLVSAQDSSLSRSTATETLTSPRSAYEDALHPLDETRRAIGNWSAAEVAALQVTLDRARTACQARNPHSYSGADLIEMARLCALGQEWGTVVLATTLYIDDTALAKTQLAEAHAARVDADLHLRSEPDALRDARAMLAAVPYSPIVAEASTEAIEYMRFSAPDDALAVATARQPFVLEELQPLSASTKTKAASVDVPSGKISAGSAVLSPVNAITKQPIRELYSQGLALPSLLQQTDRVPLAKTAFDALESALPQQDISPDDSLPIAEARRRYGLLGQPFPSIKFNRFLSMPYVLPAIPALNTVTALLVFPDWCAQCITAVAQLPETVSSVEGHSAYYYGLLEETVPEKTPEEKLVGADVMNSFRPGYASALLKEKPVVTVSTVAGSQLSATDFPFLVVTDAKGIVRVAQAVDADDLHSGGKVDSAVLLVAQRWPLPTPVVPSAGNSIGGMPRAK